MSKSFQKEIKSLDKSKTVDFVDSQEYQGLIKDYQELEKEYEIVSNELLRTLQSLITVTIKFEKLCKLTNFSDLDSLTVSEEELIEEINKL